MARQWRKYYARRELVCRNRLNCFHDFIYASAGFVEAVAGIIAGIWIATDDSWEAGPFFCKVGSELLRAEFARSVVN